MNIFIWPYSRHSKSAKALANKLEVNTIKRVGSSVVDKEDRLIVNWGSRDCPYTKAKVLNKSSAVIICSNKHTFFRHISNHNFVDKDNQIHIPDWTTEREVAERWMAWWKVCSRTVLNGNNGEGLIISDQPDDHPTTGVLLWTKYIPKTEEFRVHIFDGSVIEVQKKVWPKSKDSTGVDWTQRNYDDGFVFQSATFREVSKDIIDQAKLAVQAVGLDFAGVDVIKGTDGNAYVLEINTAPGIEGSDITLYANSIRDIAKRLSQS